MEFKTFTGLTLRWETSGGSERVTLSGENVKVLYQGADRRAAKKVYDETQAHYEERHEVEGEWPPKGRR